MSQLDNFIAAADQLIEFQSAFQQTPMVDQSLSSLEAHKIELKELWCDIKKQYNLYLRSETDGDLDAIKAKYRLSSNTYINCLSEIIEFSYKLSIIKEDGIPNVSNPNLSPDECIRVPPCEIELFYGDYLTWPSFRDMFTAVYMNHPKLSSVQKLFHLRSKTRKEANDIVSKFPLTSDSFELAWKALSDQYENRRILVNKQLKKLFNLTAITIESGKSIKDIQREINDCLSILKALNVSTTTWDPILIYLCSNRLPENTLALWEQSIQKPRDIPSWSEMDSFLTSRYRVLETVSEVKFSPKSKAQFKSQNPHPHKEIHKVFHSKASKFICKLCNGSHSLRQCQTFLQLSITDRIAKVDSLGYCTNCLSSAHLKKDCKSVHNCMQCKQRHHTLLHSTPINTVENIPLSSGTENSLQTIQSTESSNSYKVQSYFSRNNKRILLATALIDIHHMGSKFTVRALLDTGSEVTFISEEAQRRLNLPVKPIHAQISGMSAMVTTTATKLCSLCIGFKCIPTFTISANAIVLKRLTGDLPSCIIHRQEVSTPVGFELADPHFYETSKIDMVIGSDLYPSVVLEGLKSNVLGSLVAQNTIFGWVLSGPLPQDRVSTFPTFLSYFCETSVDQQIAKFWEVEEIEERNSLSIEDIYCEQLYSDTTTRDTNGRYVVRLPFKNPSLALGHSRNQALKQLLRMEKSLSKNPELWSKYNEVLQEYVTLNHMEAVSSDEIIKKDQLCTYYLPHHAVIEPESTTTKVRVVFNASSPSSNGTSLNDIFYTGPVLQTDLTTLILKWRFYRYVFTADIEKMYRQIIVHPEHSSYQRILFWNSDPSESPFQDYELKTVTFGVNCAPYLAIRTLLRLADDVQSTFPIASSILKNDFYVDDVLSGAHDIDTVLQAQSELINALGSAGFSLRKWASNCLELIKEFPASQLHNENFLKLEDKSISKTLGIQWNAKSDSFHFFFSINEEDRLLTKRAVLSVIARLFDPAGWLAPVLITGKIIMQQIWRDGTSWDAHIAPLTCHRWKTTALPDIQKVQIPRWIHYSRHESIQIHGFCDASERAYAATFYLRIQHSSDSWSSNLLCAKSKVAPVKQVPLPRLELCGAFLLSKLFRKVIAELPCLNYELFLWTDSSIVLAWLNKPSSSWKTFVANRVSKIQTYVPDTKWKHVRSADNPADLATRGLAPIDLQANNLWWHGPNWLCEPQTSWPASIFKRPDERDLEMKPIQANLTTMLPNIETIVERFSSWSRALRVICYILRFYHRTSSRFKNRVAFTTRIITQQEISYAKNLVIRQTQMFYFQNEYFSLLKNEQISKRSSLANINPILDQNQILRSNGRLTCSTLSFYEKYPIILPYQAKITSLYIKFVHDISIHGGNQLVVRLVRSEFWIPKLKNLVKKHIRKTCIIQKKKVQTQIMGALPLERTELSSSFTNTGVDFAGSFVIRSSLGRNCRLTKAYVCIFVCFATRAIHLEGTSDLSTQSFLAALSRFIARRGIPKTIFSDNGTNFVGASKVIAHDFKKFIKTVSIEVSKRYVDQNLEWKFIPPGAPHMGGLWEAGVKSFKLHFRKVAGTNKFTFEEFATLLAKIEACLNSRPISPISENSSDILPLTPGHFLRGGPLLSPLEPFLDNQSLNCVKRWEKVKILHHQFCRRWKDEYLKELHKRYKWKFPQRNVSVDDLVVIKDENLPPNEWRLGRITKVYPGSDNRVRVADIRTQNGVTTRPITKLCIITHS